MVPDHEPIVRVHRHHVLREKTQHEVAVALVFPVLAAVAAVGGPVCQMKIPAVQLDDQA